ncbi:MAG: hypothetical protein GC138_01540 [Gammaproteobacteria bacterium]|nr:hypothetical protein [Gammaproteobacteria bacterium]
MTLRLYQAGEITHRCRENHKTSLDRELFQFISGQRLPSVRSGYAVRRCDARFIAAAKKTDDSTLIFLI